MTPPARKVRTLPGGSLDRDHYALARRLWTERAESGRDAAEIARLFAREVVEGGLTIKKENAWLNTFAVRSGALYRLNAEGFVRPGIALALLDHMKLGEEHQLLELFEKHYGLGTVHEAAAVLLNAGTKPAEIDGMLAGKGYEEKERLEIIKKARELNKSIIRRHDRG